MSTINVNANAAENAQPAAKRIRRGVNNQTKATSQLRFSEKDAAPNGLFVGHLEEVKVDTSEAAEDKQFGGFAVPHLTFHFASNHSNVDERRHVYKTINPVESNIDTIPGGKEEWKVNNIFNWIKHILDVYYLKGRQLTEAEEDVLTLPFVDFDETGNLVVIDPEEVLNGYRVLFENVAAILNGSYNLADGETAKACYKTSDGKIIPVWIKLLRHKKNKNQWRNVGQNGELAFDSFVGGGAIELVKKGSNPAILTIDLSKESITPKEIKQTPNIGTPGMAMPNMMGGVAAVAPNMGFAADMNGAFADAGDGEMPF